ncbi:MAG: hypothetical protein KDK45_21845, partial [Leptospiraceae bacterium]|nr:hypothetical protein [Leptospiraceae bacterium]
MKTKLIQIFLVITIFLFQGFSIYFTETFVIKPIVGEHFLPVTNIPFPYLFNTFLLFFFYSILFFLSQKVFFSFLLSLNLFILLALIHAFKLKYLGSVLFLT